ncbi:hypothetical protein PGTDC60_1638 [Porphyromonas gingivalis TDC60]|nr:hypothetical protein PGTDC60_1638 [Porphyromonas gingivalis TDC60]
MLTKIRWKLNKAKATERAFLNKNTANGYRSTPIVEK